MSGSGPVLVVGASGFLGQALVRKLVERGCPTFSLVFADRRPVNLPGNMLCAASSKVDDVRTAIHGIDWNCVYHVAAAGVSPQQRDPEQLTDGNLGLLARVLTALSARVPRRFIFTGTCSEYSPAVSGQLITECHPTQPLNLYGAAKAAAAIFGAALAHSLKIPFVLARPFHFYGPGEGPSRLIPYLIKRLLDGAEVQLTGGDQVRDLLYVDDIADALLTIGGAPECMHSTYNVCSGSPISIRKVGELAAAVTGRPASLLRFGALPYRPDEDMWVVGDNARLKTDFGWVPRTSLGQGLSQLARQTAAVH